ncbi:MAG: DUF5615 family PIN-like protein [Nanoarchaeota archaeon]
MKFLLDENVKKRLLIFLKSCDCDVTFKQKGLSNGNLAEFSNSEHRVFVTNDNDFLECTKKDIFSIIFLKVPQDNEDLLISSFSKLLKEIKPEDFKGKLITIYENKFEISELG